MTLDTHKAANSSPNSNSSATERPAQPVESEATKAPRVATTTGAWHRKEPSMQAHGKPELRDRAFVLAAEGLAGKDIAAELGVSKSTVSRWLNPRTPPSADTAPVAVGSARTST